MHSTGSLVSSFSFCLFVIFLRVVFRLLVRQARGSNYEESTDPSYGLLSFEAICVLCKNELSVQSFGVFYPI